VRFVVDHAGLPHHNTHGVACGPSRQKPFCQGLDLLSKALAGDRAAAAIQGVEQYPGVPKYRACWCARCVSRGAGACGCVRVRRGCGEMRGVAAAHTMHEPRRCCRGGNRRSSYPRSASAKRTPGSVAVGQATPAATLQWVDLGEESLDAVVVAHIVQKHHSHLGTTWCTPWVVYSETWVLHPCSAAAGARVCGCVRVCVRACVRVCVCACVRVTRTRVDAQSFANATRGGGR